MDRYELMKFMEFQLVAVTQFAWCKALLFPARGRAQAQGRAVPGRARARPWAWAGTAVAWYFVFILYKL